MLKIITNILVFIFIINKLAISKELIIEGLIKLNKDDIQSLTTSDIYSKELNDENIDEIIKQLYNSDQIYDISLNLNNNNYILNIEESPIIDGIYINGNTIFKDEDIKKLLNSKIDLFINKSSINKDIQLIESIYSNKGYDSIFINVSTEKFSQSKVNLLFEINEGSKSKISDIKFIGNNSYSSKFLGSIINAESNKIYNFLSSSSNINKSIFDNDIILLKDFYLKNGFVDVDVSYKINKNFFNSYSLTYYIKENNRYKISDINFDLPSEIINLSGYSNLKDNFEKNLISNNKYYNLYYIDDFILELSDLIKINNLNYEINREIKKIDTEYQIVFFAIRKQPLIVNKIEIIGNSITKSNILISKIDIEPGDYFLESKVKKASENLKKYKYINGVKYTKENIDDKVNIFLEVDENKKTGNVLLGGSLNGDLGLGLIFSIKDNNFLGLGNELESDISINTEVFQFDISYKEYPFYNSNISNSYNIKNKESDLSTSFGYKIDEKSIRYSLDFKNDENISSSLGVQYSNTIGHSSTNQSDLSITDNIGTFNDILLSYSLTQDKTNNFLYPNKGYLNSVSFNISPEAISDNNYAKVSYKGDIYFDFDNSSDYIFLSNRIGMTNSFNGRNKTINAFSLGGSNFKGFDYRGIGNKTSNNKYLGGNKYFTTTIGYGSSFLFDDKDNMYIKLFYTMGSLWDSDYGNQEFNLRSSIGTSLDILTPIGPISFSYALPIQKNSSDSIRRFNFSIGTSF